MKSRLTAGLICGLTCVVAGCGVSTTNNNGASQPKGVTIGFLPPPPTTMLINRTVSLTAAVNNDPRNQGVDWDVTCEVSDCGAVYPLHTVSGQPTTYTPPSSLLGNRQSVNIAAHATADGTQSVLAPLTITAFGSNFHGTYILQAEGADDSGKTYEFAGAIVLDGDGMITGGEQTVDFFDPNSGGGNFVSKTANVSGGFYYLGPDGRGTITIQTDDPNVSETFSLVFLSTSQALIALLGGNAPHAQGTMDLQANVVAPVGGYVFVVSGTEVAGQYPTALGGILNIDNTANCPAPQCSISGQGSTVDRNHFNAQLTPPQFHLTETSQVSGAVTKPEDDPFGAVTMKLEIAFPPDDPTQPPPPGEMTFKGYVVDSSRIKLIETDPDGLGNGFASTAGLALAQGTNTGNFLPSQFSGAFVFAVLGTDGSTVSSNVPGGLPESMTSAGVFETDPAMPGHYLAGFGFSDTFFLRNCGQPTCTLGGILGAQISSDFTSGLEAGLGPPSCQNGQPVCSGGYGMSPSGIGRVRATVMNFAVPAPNSGPVMPLQPTFSPVLIFYLTGKGGPALVLDGGDSTQHYPSTGKGVAYPLQSTAPNTLAGKYGISLTRNNGSESDLTGQLSTTSSDGNFTGFITSVSAVINGNFGNPVIDGHSTFGLGGNDSGPNAFNFIGNLYAIDSSHGFVVETNLLVSPSAALPPSGNVSLGYFAARTPVCSGCP